MERISTEHLKVTLENNIQAAAEAYESGDSEIGALLDAHTLKMEERIAIREAAGIN